MSDSPSDLARLTSRFNDESIAIANARTLKQGDLASADRPPDGIDGYTWQICSVQFDVQSIPVCAEVSINIDH